MTHHKIPGAILAALLLLCCTSSMAQLYKTIGPDGKVTYSDTPPPTGKSERKNISGNGSNEANLPYELATAARNHPVTFYSMAKCPVCDEARTLLRQRGIPFNEKTITSAEDQIKLREVSGGVELPFVSIGRDKKRGFQPEEWQAALTAAGYPLSSKLPGNYAYRAPEAAAPVAPPKPVATPAPAATATPVPQPGTVPPPENAPPGFRF
ncbi:MAG: hypothetical protein RL748_1954 [Pseudomonadota bacterium]|jgi:glutaredoxin